MDYAQLVKIYGEPPADTPERKYSPGDCCGIIKSRVAGSPDPSHVSTSYVERHNLTMRMSMRRFTRLTNGFSKKMDNHFFVLALYFFHYNFCRIYKALRVTPAMQAGITDRLWTMEELVEKMDALLYPARPRGPYKKRDAP